MTYWVFYLICFYLFYLVVLALFYIKGKRLDNHSVAIYAVSINKAEDVDDNIDRKQIVYVDNRKGQLPASIQFEKQRFQNHLH